MNSPVRVSVIMPVHNCEPYVDAAIRSVLAQTESEFELLVIENSSTDRSETIIEALANEDSRIRIIRSPEILYPSIARNRALREARGDWITFLDADDLWHPERLKHHLAAGSAQPILGSAFVFSDYKRFQNEPDESACGLLQQRNFLQKAEAHIKEFIDLPTGERFYILQPTIYNFITAYWNAIHTSALTFPRSLLMAQDVWFRDDYYVNEDLELWLRLLDSCAQIVYVPQVLSYYRYRPGSVTTNESAWTEGMVQLHTNNYEAHRERYTPIELQAYRQRIADFHFNLGYYRSRHGDAVGARQAYLKSFRYRPALMPLLAWAKTYVPNRIRTAVQFLLSR